MKLQYIFLIFFALFITGLADGVEVGMAGIGVAPSVIPVIGVVIAGVTEPIGILMGIAASWSINITMGAGLLMLLAYNGMFGPAYWRYITPGFIGETIPGINSLPFWVVIVILCIMKKTSEESEGVLDIVSRAASAAVLVESSPATSVGAVRTLASIRSIKEQANTIPKEDTTPSRIPLTLSSVGINRDIQPHVPKTA